MLSLLFSDDIQEGQREREREKRTGKKAVERECEGKRVRERKRDRVRAARVCKDGHLNENRERASSMNESIDPACVYVCGKGAEEEETTTETGRE